MASIRKHKDKSTLEEVEELLFRKNVGEALDLLLQRSSNREMRERVERLRQEYLQIRLQELSESFAGQAEQSKYLNTQIRAIAREIDRLPDETPLESHSEHPENQTKPEPTAMEQDSTGVETAVREPEKQTYPEQAPLSKLALRILANQEKTWERLRMKFSNQETHPKHLLALEGEGPNALGTLAALLALEQALRRQSGRSDYRLCQSFELVGGTGLSAFFATAIALGQPVSAFQAVFTDKITLLYSNPRTDMESVQLYLLDFMREYFAQDTLADADWQSGVCYFLRHYESGQPLLIDNHPEGKSQAEYGVLPLAQLVMAAGNPFAGTAVQLDTTPPRRVLDISHGLFRNPELLLFYHSTDPEAPFQWPAYASDLRLCSIGTRLDPDITDPVMQQNMASQSAPTPAPFATPHSPLSAAQYQHQRLSRWLLEGESLAGSHTDIRPALGSNPALVCRIALPPVPESRLLDWEYLHAQADRALESADLSAFLPKLQAQ